MTEIVSYADGESPVLSDSRLIEQPVWLTGRDRANARQACQLGRRLKSESIASFSRSASPL
jgi:hypothetical protein